MKNLILLLFVILLGCQSNSVVETPKLEYDFTLKTKAAYKSNVAVSYNSGPQGKVRPIYMPVYISRDDVPKSTVEGYAIFNFKIDRVGKPKELKIVETSVNGLERELLLRVFSGWHFIPIKKQPKQELQYKFIYKVNPK